MGCFSGIIPSLRRGRDAHGSSRNADEDVSTPVQTVSDFLVPRVPTVASSKQTLKPPPSECYCQFSGTSEPAEDWHTEFPLPAYSLNDVWDVEGAKAIEGCIDSLDTELRDLSIKIHGELVCQSNDGQQSLFYAQTIPNSDTKRSEQRHRVVTNI